MTRILAALRRFDDSPEGGAFGLCLLATVLLAGLILTGVQ
jgi:hypothetical protein